MNDKRITYPQPMLPHVDYELLSDDYSDSLSDLEFSAFENYRHFLEALEQALLKTTMVQIPELVVTHLCCYLGSIIAVYKGDKAKQLEPDIINLLKQHADLAYSTFNQHPINSSVATQTQKEVNLNKLRENSPGSIVNQTLRLGRYIMDMMARLSDNCDDKLGSSQQKQEDLLCPLKELFAFLIPLLNKHHHAWQEKLRSKSINHAINQLTIQIGWLIGYFAHLDNQLPEEGQYLAYGLPCITLYREYTHELLQIMREKDQILTSSLKRINRDAYTRVTYYLSKCTLLRRLPSGMRA